MHRFVSDTTKAVRNQRVCYDCGTDVVDPAILICPECGSEDIDLRRSRPKKSKPRPHVELPHPWSLLKFREGGTVLLSGDRGSGKTTICLQAKPQLYVTTEQAINEVASTWYRLYPDEQEDTPLFTTNCKDWDTLNKDLMTLGPGELGIVDSISQLESLHHSSSVVRRVIEQTRKRGVRVIFISQYNKSGDVYGPNELAHLVDVVCDIPKDFDGLRRLVVSKNRFGNLFTTYFGLGERGATRLSWPYAYSVEGSPGDYQLLMYPIKRGAKFNGLLELLRDAGIITENVASAAIPCQSYRNGFAEPSDVEERRRFAEQHGLRWIGPDDANAALSSLRAMSEGSSAPIALLGEQAEPLDSNDVSHQEF